MKMYKKILYFMVLLICLCGCMSHSDSYLRNKRNLLKSYSDFNQVSFLVDSISDGRFVLLISKENHLFLVPENELDAINNKTSEQNIFQISGAGLFDWTFKFSMVLPHADLEKFLYGNHSEYECRFGFSERMDNEYIKPIPFCSNFDIVPMVIKPRFYYKFLIQGCAYHIGLRNGWDDMFICRSGKAVERAVNCNRFFYIPFLDPFAYYPLYVPMFEPDEHNYCE